MQLNEETSSAISEIGNLCIAGGSNQISTFADELVDISVVQAQIEDTMDLALTLDVTDDCKVFIGLQAEGDVNGYFVAKVSDELVEATTARFPKLKSAQAGQDRITCLIELVENFLLGFTQGMAGMTGLQISPSGSASKLTELDLSKFPKKVLCYSSVISVGNERIDFDVFFFSDADVLIPKVLESLGM